VGEGAWQARGGEREGPAERGGGSAETAAEVMAEVERKETYDVTATLRLLRLLVKYGELVDDLFAANVSG
jgi:hypothetical protein